MGVITIKRPSLTPIQYRAEEWEELVAELYEYTRDELWWMARCLPTVKIHPLAEGVAAVEGEAEEAYG